MLAHSQNLTEALALTTNFGVSWDGNSGDVTGIYIINFSFPLSAQIGAFVEAYANSSDGDFDVSFDTGITYLVNNNLQLDMSGGYGKNDGLSEFFVDAGVSWRFGRNGN